jgi:hypothetical protein
MENSSRVYIGSEIYRAVVPHIARYTHAAYARFRVLPKWEVVRNFIVLYLTVGFIIEGIAAALPALALQFLGVPPQIVGILGIAVFLFWPFIMWQVLGEVEHVTLSLSLLFIGATYVSHLKHGSAIVADGFVDARAALEGANSHSTEEILPPRRPAQEEGHARHIHAA